MASGGQRASERASREARGRAGKKGRARERVSAQRREGAKARRRRHAQAAMKEGAAAAASSSAAARDRRASLRAPSVQCTCTAHASARRASVPACRPARASARPFAPPHLSVRIEVGVKPDDASARRHDSRARRRVRVVVRQPQQEVEAAALVRRARGPRHEHVEPHGVLRVRHGHDALERLFAEATVVDARAVQRGLRRRAGLRGGWVPVGHGGRRGGRGGEGPREGRAARRARRTARSTAYRVF